MNWDYRDRERYSNLKVVPLTPEQEAPWHEQLKVAEARYERNMVELRRIMATTAEIARKRAIRAAIRPMQLPLPMEVKAA